MKNLFWERASFKASFDIGWKPLRMWIWLWMTSARYFRMWEHCKFRNRCTVRRKPGTRCFRKRCSETSLWWRAALASGQGRPKARRETALGRVLTEGICSIEVPPFRFLRTGQWQWDGVAGPAEFRSKPTENRESGFLGKPFCEPGLKPLCYKSLIVL